MAAAAADSRQHLANPGRGEAHTRHGDGDRCHRPPAAVQRHTNGDDCSFPLTAVSPYLRLLVVLRSRRRRASSSEPNPSSGTLDGGRAGRTLRRAGQPERLCRRTSDGREEQRRCATRGAALSFDAGGSGHRERSSVSSKSAIAGPGWYVRSARSALLVLEGEPQLGAVSDATVAVDMNVLFDNLGNSQVAERLTGCFHRRRGGILPRLGAGPNSSVTL
jgi:hypothetical protein